MRVYLIVLVFFDWFATTEKNSLRTFRQVIIQEPAPTCHHISAARPETWGTKVHAEYILNFIKNQVYLKKNPHVGDFLLFSKFSAAWESDRNGASLGCAFATP